MTSWSPPARTAPANGRHGEPPHLDRNVAELLQELRLTAIGVQVLFGFLLGLPFDQRFTHLSAPQRGLYVGDLVLAAVSIALLGGPAAFHRLVLHRHERPEFLAASNTMAVAGLAVVGLSVSGAVTLIVSFVAPLWVAAVLVAAVLATFAGLWFVVPLAARQRAPVRD